ncbi:hypothetical protein PoB_007151700 [Plakobranchus ocellatus]|uniref:Lipocalin/cytosolic fatty-acid binding domain-containing protein n=1 Tax=Plakobranchus ocellatus TaxID=259542 RepID=A0AAV4DL55_9GAST|nr:hypothetical protein PoB_007151700 [Plakobranchus ocellatus]
MVDQLLGNWKLEKNENLDAYMKANNVNIVLRKVGNTITSYEEIKREGENWTINITSTFRNSKLEFKLGQPFTEDTLDGRRVTTTFTIEGSKLVAIQEPTKEGDLPSKFERELQEDGRMVLTCISLPENVVAKRYFQPYSPKTPS